MIETGPSSVLIPARPELGVRSEKWPALEHAWKKEHPTCAACGTEQGEIDVHHVQAFHVNPKKELDPKNLITLCRPHHFLFGHLEDWRSWNVDVRKDAARMLREIQSRPYTKEHKP